MMENEKNYTKSNLHRKKIILCEALNLIYVGRGERDDLKSTTMSRAKGKMKENIPKIKFSYDIVVEWMKEHREREEIEYKKRMKN